MNPLGRFMLRVFLWLPLCFGIWYFATILVAVPLAWLLDRLSGPAILGSARTLGRPVSVLSG